MSRSDSFEFLVNPSLGTAEVAVLPLGGLDQAKATIMAWPEYMPTPLRDPRDVAGPAVVRIKDKGFRFGLGSFKAPGGAYAVML